MRFLAPTDLKVLFSVLYFITAFNSSSAQQVLRPEFVAELNPATESSEPEEFTEFQGEIYFTALTKAYDNSSRALWRFRNGVAEKVFPEDPDDTHALGRLTVFGDELFVTADLEGGWELFSFDGSVLSKMSERFPGLPPVATSNSNDALTVWGNELLIHEDDSLWVYDGEEVENRGQLLLGYATYGCPEVQCTRLRAVEFNGELFFASRSVATHRYLTKYDGQDMVHVDAYDSTFSGYPENLTVFNGTLFFSAEKGSGRELYKYDGNSIELVSDIIPGSGSSNPRDLYVFQDELLFTAMGAGGYHNLWRLGTDGSLGNLGLSFDYSRGIPDFTPLGSDLYFFAGSFRDTGWELYRYNGSSASVVQDVVDGSNAHVDSGSRLTLFDGNLYYRGWDVANGSGLFRFDGTGRHLVVKTYWVPETSQVTSNGLITSLRHAVYGSEPHIIEVGGGPPQLADDVNTTPLGSGARSIVKHGRLIYLAGGGYLFRLYQFLPLTKSVELVDDGSLTNVDLLASVDDKLYFSAEDEQNGIALRVLSASGIEIVNTSKDGSSYSGQFAALNGNLYFIGQAEFPSPSHLWKHSNGEVTFINDDDIFYSFGERAFYVFDGALYYRRWGEMNSIDLRKYEEPVTSTIGQITDDYIGTIPSGEIVGFGDRIFFSADKDLTGTELWAFADSSSNLVADIFPGAGSSLPSDFVVHNDTLYFFATTPNTGRELFLLDGETARVVAEVVPGSAGSNPDELVSFDGGLYWAAEDSVGGRQMWRYLDGNIEVLTEVFTEPIGTDPSTLTVVDDELYFFAFDDERGRELWRLSKSGTSSVDDNLPSNYSSFSISNPYPNPTGGVVMIDLSVGDTPEVRLQIYDVLGREVLSLMNNRLSGGASNTVTIDVAHLPQGVYFVRAEGAGKSSGVTSFVLAR